MTLDVYDFMDANNDDGGAKSRAEATVENMAAKPHRRASSTFLSYVSYGPIERR